MQLWSVYPNVKTNTKKFSLRWNQMTQECVYKVERMKFKTNQRGVQYINLFESFKPK